MEDSLITVAELSNNIEADMACMNLESEGIECFKSGDQMASIYTSGIPFICIQVREADVQKAVKLIAASGNPQE